MKKYPKGTKFVTTKNSELGPEIGHYPNGTRFVMGEDYKTQVEPEFLGQGQDAAKKVELTAEQWKEFEANKEEFMKKYPKGTKFVTTKNSELGPEIGHYPNGTRYVMGEDYKTQDKGAAKKGNKLLMAGCPESEPDPSSVCPKRKIDYSCDYGKECCCGQCSHSREYHCLTDVSQWSVQATDFCENPSCSKKEPSSLTEWTDWSEWGKCIEGFRKRTRKCVNPQTKKEEKGKCKPKNSNFRNNFSDTEIYTLLTSQKQKCPPSTDEVDKKEKKTAGKSQI